MRKIYQNFREFNMVLVRELGFNKAMLLSDIIFFCNYNMSRNQNFYEGRFWTYDTLESITKRNFYLTSNQVEKALRNLCDEGYIVKGNFNKVQFDRTSWYAPTDKGIELYNYAWTTLDYAIENHMSTSISPNSEMDFAKFRNQISPNGETYTSTIPVVEPVSIRNELSKSNDLSNSSKKDEPQTSSKRFQKPTIEEIEAYCKERANGIDAESFFDFYESKGWLVGKTPMKDWKAAVRTWERSRNSQSPQEQRSQEAGSDYQRQKDIEFYNARLKEERLQKEKEDQAMAEIRAKAQEQLNMLKTEGMEGFRKMMANTKQNPIPNFREPLKKRKLSLEEQRKALMNSSLWDEDAEKQYNELQQEKEGR